MKFIPHNRICLRRLKTFVLIPTIFVLSDVYSRVWDVADYVVPPAENGAFFVATNVIVTPNQTRGESIS